MARGKKYSEKIREKALALYITSQNANEVANQLDIPVSTVRTWIKESEQDEEYNRLRKLKQKKFVNDGWSGIEIANSILMKRLNRANEKEEYLDKLIDLYPDLQNLNQKELQEIIKAVRDVQMHNVKDIASVISTLIEKTKILEAGEKESQDIANNNSFTVDIKVVE